MAECERKEMGMSDSRFFLDEGGNKNGIFKV